MRGNVCEELFQFLVKFSRLHNDAMYTPTVCLKDLLVHWLLELDGLGQLLMFLNHGAIQKHREAKIFICVFLRQTAF